MSATDIPNKFLKEIENEIMQRNGRRVVIAEEKKLEIDRGIM
jgi:hypothetical protein